MEPGGEPGGKGKAALTGGGGGRRGTLSPSVPRGEGQGGGGRGGPTRGGREGLARL